ncbi:MAG: ribonuclease D, partial [Alphaproteobacteria bacterium]
VDTEFMREKTFWPNLCLIQLAGPDEAAAIDPLASDVDLAPLYTLLANRKVPKVVHGARQDIEIFFHLTGKIPTPLIDTQIAAMVCGFGDQVGYETLVARLTGHRLDKSSRFTDWSLRPLTEKQLTYALGDVIYLREAYEALRDRIEENGRAAWLDEELAILTADESYKIDPATAWHRLKPRSTDRRYLAILREVTAWRENEAMQRDIPRNRVLRDEALSEIAAHPPETRAALGRIRGVSRGFADNRAGEGLLKAVAAGLGLAIEDAPQPRPKVNLPRGLAPVVDLLKVLLKQRCEHHNVAQKLVASTADLERIAADDEAPVPTLQGWRREIFGADALALKHGRVALAANNGHVQLVAVDGDGKAQLPTAPPPSQDRPPGRRRKRRRERRPTGSTPPQPS